MERIKSSDLWIIQRNKAAQERVNAEYAERLKFKRRRNDYTGAPPLTDRWGQHSERWVGGSGLTRGGKPITSSGKSR